MTSARRPHVAESAALVAADTGSRVGHGAFGAGPGAGSPARGGCSTRAHALVPPNPKELTAANLGPVVAGHGASFRCTRMPRRWKSIFGFGDSKCRLGGISPSRTHNVALMSPAMPAAGSRCPMLVLIEPTAHGLSGARHCPNTAPIALASIGSPTAVPVPCASI